MNGPTEDPDVFMREGRTFDGNGAASAEQDTPATPLTIEEWLTRDLPEPDFLLGSWLSTSSRALFVAATGVGKTNVALAIAISIAAGTGFLHWTGRRPARVLFIDGEMSRRLLRQRLRDAVKRIGCKPAGLLTLSHEDIPSFAPLNTVEGQSKIEAIIKQHGPFDLIVFDNIMCLIDGDQKDEEGWRQILPWVLSLTRRGIGQLWIHHTGHDESRSYGTKTREWQMDTVLHAIPYQRDDTDISFDLTFRKARERTPATREDFRDVRIALVDDAWTFEAAPPAKRQKASPHGMKFLDALTNVLATDAAVAFNGRQASTMEAWQAECTTLGLIDRKAKPDSARALFSKFRRELVACNMVGCEGDFAWLIR